MVKYRAFIGRRLLSHSIELLYKEGGESACLIGPWDTPTCICGSVVACKNVPCNRRSLGWYVFTCHNTATGTRGGMRIKGTVAYYTLVL